MPHQRRQRERILFLLRAEPRPESVSQIIQPERQASLPAYAIVSAAPLRDVPPGATDRGTQVSNIPALVPNDLEAVSNPLV